MAHDTNYEAILDRTGTTSTSRDIPPSVASEVVKEAVEQSSAMSLGKVFRMPSGVHEIPVLKAFAEAYWLHGDASDTRGGLGTGTDADKDSAVKSRTAPEWTQAVVKPDELAVMVPVPDAWMQDSTVTWEEIRSEVSRAFAKKIDQAILFGGGQAPSSFGNGVVNDALAAGNQVNPGTGAVEGSWGASGNDLALDIAALGELLDSTGYDVTGFASYRGLRWQLRRLRDANGGPILQEDVNGRTLYGEPLHLSSNGAWDKTLATVLAGEWDKLIIGVRQDITFRVFDQAVLTDPSTGDISYNAVEQDGKVLRAVMRLGYVVPTPVKALGGTYPFAVISDES